MSARRKREGYVHVPGQPAGRLDPTPDENARSVCEGAALVPFGNDGWGEHAPGCRGSFVRRGARGDCSRRSPECFAVYQQRLREQQQKKGGR